MEGRERGRRCKANSLWCIGSNTCESQRRWQLELVVFMQFFQDKTDCLTDIWICNISCILALFLTFENGYDASEIVHTLLCGLCIYKRIKMNIHQGADKGWMTHADTTVLFLSFGFVQWKHNRAIWWGYGSESLNHNWPDDFNEAPNSGSCADSIKLPAALGSRYKVFTGEPHAHNSTALILIKGELWYLATVWPGHILQTLMV